MQKLEKLRGIVKYRPRPGLWLPGSCPLRCLRAAVIYHRVPKFGDTMDKNQCELFVQFVYADSLTYEELLSAEGALMARLEEILSAAGAAHLDFTPLGDMLGCQCVFELCDLDKFRVIAAGIAAILPDGITGRLLCLDKSLVRLNFFWLRKGTWQECGWPVPLTAPADATCHHVSVASEQPAYTDKAENSD